MIRIEKSRLSGFAWLLGAALLLNLGGCTSVRDRLVPPTVDLVNIRPQSLREGRTLMAVSRLRVSNPNDTTVPVEGGMVKMTLAGKPVAEGELTEGFVLPANGYEEIDVRINLDLATSLTVGMAMLEGETVLPYTLDGYIDVGIAYLGRINIAERGEVSLNQLRPTSNPETSDAL
jgi:LEA14-like dessication related protein